jgi:HlyD family secretion protein
MKRIVIIIVVLSAGLGVALYFQLEAQTADQRAPAGGTGVIEGVEVDVVARLPARILEIRAHEGDRVAAGEVLVVLDCSEPRAALNQARAQQAAAEASLQAAEAGADAARRNSRAARQAVEAAAAQIESMRAGKDNAVREVERVAAMRRAGAISESRLDRAQTQVENLAHQIAALRANRLASRQKALAAQGQAQVAEAKVLAARGQVQVARAAVMRAEANAAECELEAPRAGVVLRRNFEPGEAVLPGAAVLSTVDLEQARAIFFLPNDELAAAAPGKAVTVRADAYPERSFAGTIRHVAAEAEFTPRNVQTREDRDRLVYAVEIAVPNPDHALRPGMPVEVSIDGSAPTVED